MSVNSKLDVHLQTDFDFNIRFTNEGVCQYKAEENNMLIPAELIHKNWVGGSQALLYIFYYDFNHFHVRYWLTDFINTNVCMKTGNIYILFGPLVTMQ